MDTTSIAISVFSSIYCKFDRDGGMKMTETDIKSSAPAAEKKSNFIKKYNEQGCAFCAPLLFLTPYSLPRFHHKTDSKQ